MLDQKQVIALSIQILCISGLYMLHSSNSSSSLPVPVKSINVTGNGKTSVVPDFVRYSVTFTDKDETAVLRSKNGFQTHIELFASIRDLTTKLYRNWTYVENKRIQGEYHAQVSFEISLNDAQEIQIPKNAIFNHQYIISDTLRQSVQDIIIKKAIRNAKEQVEISLTEIGEKEYTVTNLSINRNSSPYSQMNRMSTAMGVDNNNLESGEEDLSISINMTVSY